MSGQSAALSLKEACAMQERVQASGGGSKKSSSSPKESHRKEKSTKEK